MFFLALPVFSFLLCYLFLDAMIVLSQFVQFLFNYIQLLHLNFQPIFVPLKYHIQFFQLLLHPSLLPFQLSDVLFPLSVVPPPVLVLVPSVLAFLSPELPPQSPQLTLLLTVVLLLV